MKPPAPQTSALRIGCSVDGPRVGFTAPATWDSAVDDSPEMGETLVVMDLATRPVTIIL